ncbi:A24 family peptidase [Paenibacillus glycanilyticus]|uniref:Prepilin type IV endopeptidase peptidase domain-containing protein n=1 Tax=Paenibacillus glycanilyticus TaxID=126569 RepID=A0ABQ6GCQ4_9BACL|nr:A24 family peptidase [Paenibacillus glycanilyticus]GLX68714.1 hypothetical protein MU1_30590 [Paenibacillus glycanilyticus]
MGENPYFILVPAFLLLAVCLYTDLKERKIYDKYTISGMLYFIGIHAVLGTFYHSLLGWLIIGGIAYVLAVISKGQIGGGDIKLYAMLGAAFGWEQGLVVLVLTSVAAALWALPLLLLKALKRLPAGYHELPLAPFITAGVILMLVISNLASLNYR